jgi:hypothetical protein
VSPCVNAHVLLLWFGSPISANVHAAVKRRVVGEETL